MKAFQSPVGVSLKAEASVCTSVRKMELFQSPVGVSLKAEVQEVIGIVDIVILVSVPRRGEPQG